MPKCLYLVVSCFLLSVQLTAQTSPAAEGPGISLWVGASFSTFNPDYGCSSNSPFACWNHQLMGISPHAETNAFLFGRIGMEGQARFLHWHGGDGMTINSYMAGPRVRLWNHKNLLFSSKFLFGIAHLDLDPFSGNYFAFAPGGSADYRVAKRWTTRLDYEYQIWPGFADSGLTPNGLSLGVSYALW
jgi:Outer membrane protein beta-barrel domain